MGRVIVRALNTAPIITKTQIEINTATVISLVNAAVARAFLFGVTPRAKVPRYSPFQGCFFNSLGSLSFLVSCKAPSTSDSVAVALTGIPSFTKPSGSVKKIYLKFLLERQNFSATLKSSLV